MRYRQQSPARGKRLIDCIRLDSIRAIDSEALDALSASVGLGAAWVTNATKGALQGFDSDTGDVREIRAGERPFSLVLAEDGIWVGDAGDDQGLLRKALTRAVRNRTR